MAIVITDTMVEAYAVAWNAADVAQMGDRPSVEPRAGNRRRAGLQAALDILEPEAKRELAAQLLQAANEAEGHPAP